MNLNSVFLVCRRRLGIHKDDGDDHDDDHDDDDNNNGETMNMHSFDGNPWTKHEQAETIGNWVVLSCRHQTAALHLNNEISNCYWQHRGVWWDIGFQNPEQDNEVELTEAVLHYHKWTLNQIGSVQCCWALHLFQGKDGFMLDHVAIQWIWYLPEQDKSTADHILHLDIWSFQCILGF